jgi:tetratricopeptide (TPR) repeat protein
VEFCKSSRENRDHALALEAAPKDLAAAVEIAKTLVDLNRLEEAEARYRAVVERAPGHLAALTGLAELARRRGDMSAALDWFGRAAASDPSKIPLQLQVGRTLQSLDRLDEAEATFRRVVERSPGCAPALAHLAEIVTRRGDLPAALALYQRATSSDPGMVLAQLGMADTLRKLGRFGEADERYRAVLEQRPDHVRALEGLAETARSRGDATAALAWFKAAAASQPQRLSVQLEMADILRELGRFDEADAGYRAVLEQRPDHVRALEGLGDTARSRGDLTAALAWFETVAANQPHRLSVQLKIGGVLQVLGRYGAAEARYRAVLERIPGQVGALVGLGQIARLQGNLDAALSSFQAAAASEPDNTTLQIPVANTLSELLRFDEAEKLYRAILQASPDNVRALIGIGHLERRRKNNEAALAFFEAAAAKAPEDPNVWLLVASALRGLCRFEEAAEIQSQIKNSAGIDKSELQVRQFEHFCLTLQLAEAEKCLLAWGGHRCVPKNAVILTAELFAALGQWSNVLAFFRERVVESEWTGSYERMIEPLTRAARETGRYAEVCELLKRLPDISTSGALRLAHDQLAEEMKLLRLLNPTRLQNQALDTTIADPFRAGRSELVARVLLGRRAPRKPPANHFYHHGTTVAPRRGRTLPGVSSSTRAKGAAGKRQSLRRPAHRSKADHSATEIFTCTDAGYLIGASVCIFSLLKHNNQKSLRDCRFTVFCADEILDLGTTVFGRISAALATPIDVRVSSSLLSNALDLRTGWGVFTPGHGLSQAAYYRIYAARRLIDEGASDRALYIDADTCVFSGVDRLLAFELAGQPLGVCLDDEKNPAIRRAATLLGLEPDRYFNSGVLVFDLRHPELRPTLNRAIEISLTEQHRLTFVDQCALNLAFRDRFATLPEHFNLRIKPDTVVESISNEPTIIHFIMRPKPWDPMYATPNCMPWFTELAAMGEVIAPSLMKRLLALQYPAANSSYGRRQ